jgi:acyl-CoA thioesterase YciA
MSEAREPAIRVAMMPRDTNAFGTIFGGVLLSYIDQAGAVEVHKHTTKKIVTVAMREVVFIQPVFVGDLVSFYTETVRIGRTSITVRVFVEADRFVEIGSRTAGRGRERVKVTEAEVVYVAVSDERRPVPLVDE